MFVRPFAAATPVHYHHVEITLKKNPKNYSVDDNDENDDDDDDDNDDDDDDDDVNDDDKDVDVV